MISMLNFWIVLNTLVLELAVFFLTNLIFIYLFVSDSTKVHHNTKNKKKQTDLSGTTQSINMHVNLAKM